MKSPSELSEWVDQMEKRWVRAKRDKTPLRQGQFYMNELYKFDPQLYHAIQPTDANPFYLDERLNTFIGKLAELVYPNP